MCAVECILHKFQRQVEAILVFLSVTPTTIRFQTMNWRRNWQMQLFFEFRQSKAIEANKDERRKAQVKRSFVHVFCCCCCSSLNICRFIQYNTEKMQSKFDVENDVNSNEPNVNVDYSCIGKFSSLFIYFRSSVRSFARMNVHFSAFFDSFCFGWFFVCSNFADCCRHLNKF